MFTAMVTPFLEGGPSEATQTLQLEAFIHRRLIELIVQIVTPAGIFPETLINEHWLSPWLKACEDRKTRSHQISPTAPPHPHSPNTAAWVGHRHLHRGAKLAAEGVSQGQAEDSFGLRSLHR